MTDINQHIYVAKDGTRTTHDELHCPFAAQYGPYKGRRETINVVMRGPAKHPDGPDAPNYAQRKDDA